MPTDSFGSARWADFEDMGLESIHVLEWFDPQPQEFFTSLEHRFQNFMYDDPLSRAFFLGRVADPFYFLGRFGKQYSSSLAHLLQGQRNIASKFPNHYITWNGDGHLITIAPTRSGKGVGVVIPNLVSYPGSVIVVDPKGENYSITAKFRKLVLGQQVVCLDPFGIVTEDCDVLNPLDMMPDPSNPLFSDNASLLAEAIIIKEKDQKDPHWDEKARTLIKALIMAVAAGSHSARHLGIVRQILMLDSDSFEQFLEKMKEQTGIADGILARAANEFLSMGLTERGSVLSTAQRHTEFLDSPLALRCLSNPRKGDKSSYNMGQLKRSGQVSVYLVLPPHHMARYSRLMRIWLTMAFHAVTSVAGNSRDGCPVLFMLDEMAQLGRMEQLIQAVSLLAGYHMTLWMIWQDLAQIKSLYPSEWTSFLANAKVQQFFGINDAETAKYLSEQLGKATVGVQTKTQGVSMERGFIAPKSASDSSGVSYSEKERPILSIDEVRRLERLAMIMLVQGCPPILAERITYYQDNFMSRCCARP